MTDQELEEIIIQINDIFYDKVYEDEWLKLVFEQTDIENIKAQQSDFMLGALGGPKKYSGRSPKDAHPHLFIQEDMWQLREQYLLEAFKKVNAPEWMQEKWLAIDNAFKRSIIKGSVAECFGRYKNEEIINIPNPKNLKKAS